MEVAPSSVAPSLGSGLAAMKGPLSRFDMTRRDSPLSRQAEIIKAVAVQIAACSWRIKRAYFSANRKCSPSTYVERFHLISRARLPNASRIGVYPSLVVTEQSHGLGFLLVIWAIDGSKLVLVLSHAFHKVDGNGTQVYPF